VTDPPIEISHNWRQTTSLMVARNFYQGNHDVRYPTIDEAGNKQGVIAMEFPALSYSIYIVSSVFGYEHWYGRLINLILVSIGSWFFFLLLSSYFDKKLAFIATVVFACSSLLHLARKVMPDPASLSLVIMGIYFGMRYLQNKKWQYLIAYFILACLGTLVKIPFGLYLSVLLFPFLNKDVGRITRLNFALCSLLLLAVVYYWYFVWNVHLSETFGTWYNSGKSIREGMKELFNHRSDVFSKFYFHAFMGYLFFILAAVGLCYAFYKKDRRIMMIFFILTPLILVYMMKSGFLFAHHGYYALVLVPLLSVSIAYLLHSLPYRYMMILLVAATAESIANQQHDFFISEKEFFKLRLEKVAAQCTQPQDLVALVSNPNPNEFYFLNRKGWIVDPTAYNIEHIDSLRKAGCKYLFVPQKRNQETLPYERTFENHEYLVLKLQ
jgi:hypothetical protein